MSKNAKTPLKQDEKRIRKPAILYSTGSVIIGIVLVFGELYLRKSIFQTVNSEQDILLKIAELIGLTIFTGGALGFALQLKDWREYFEDRLSNILLRQNYLESLDPNTLAQLQVNTLKAYFKTKDIDREGSFLNYFQSNLSQYIKAPYREAVKTELFVLSHDRGTFRMKDRITYDCRQVGGKIQSSIRWKPDEGEFVDIEQLEMNIYLNKTQKTCLLKFEKEKKKYFIHMRDKKRYQKRDPKRTETTLREWMEKGFEASLEDFNQDRLPIEVVSTYRMQRGKFLNWSMAHPTKNFDITISYPRQWRLRFQPLLAHPDKIIRTDTPGFYSMRYNEWILPFSGVAYSFVPNTDRRR